MGKTVTVTNYVNRHEHLVGCGGKRPWNLNLDAPTPVGDVVGSQADLDALDETDSSDRPSHTLSS
jgi:hypothetical protein